MENKLNIISVEKDKKSSFQKTRREETVERFNRLWKEHPNQLENSCHVIDRERTARTLHLIHEFLQPEGKKIVDLGCGQGHIVEQLAKEGAFVRAIDICNIPLQQLQEKNIANLTVSQDFIPFTTVEDDKYDLSISTEVIGFIPPEHYRLYFSELVRVVHPNGHCICSTAIDIYSEDALARFLNFAETELKILKLTLSRHSLYLRLLATLQAATKYVNAANNADLRKKEIDERTWNLSKLWFQINSSKILKPLWQLTSGILRPIIKRVQQNRSLLIVLEKICEFFDTGISHVIVIGIRRPLVEPQEEIPKERKQKKQVWE